jgi:putative glycosyltransferase (TIGR04372 family)
MKRLVKFLLLPPAFTTLIVFRLVRRFVSVRLYVCNSSFLGHVALEPDTYLSASTSGRFPRTIDVWSFGSRSVQANHVLVDLWRQRLTVWPSWIVDRLIHAGEIVKSLRLEVIPGDIFGSHRWDDTGPFLVIPESMESRCLVALRELGIPDDAPICCLIVRDDGYWSNEDQYNLSGEPRNRSIDEFELSAKVIAEDGYWVFRMGERVKGALRVDHPRVFDYGNSALQSKEMDIYLLSRCSFAFSSLTGPAAVALAFRRPVFYFDVTLIMQCFHGSKLISWNPSNFVEVETGRVLGLEEIFNRGIAWFRTAQDFRSAGIKINNHNHATLAIFARDAIRFSHDFWSETSSLDVQQLAAQITLTKLMAEESCKYQYCSSVLSRAWLEGEFNTLNR